MINLLQMDWIIWNCWLREKWQKVNYLFFSFIWSRTCFVCKSRVRSLVVLFNFNRMFHWWYLVYWAMVSWFSGLWCFVYSGCHVLTLGIVILCLSGLWWFVYPVCDVLTIWIVMSWLPRLWCLDYLDCDVMSVRVVISWLFGLWWSVYPDCDVLTIRVVMSWPFGLLCHVCLGCDVLWCLFWLFLSRSSIFLLSWSLEK